MLDELPSGSIFSYYFICQTKLWLAGHRVNFESFDENVKIGKEIDRDTYKRKKKGVEVGNSRIDALEKNNSRYSIIEIKKSKKMMVPEIWQLKYYLYISGTKNRKGLIYFSESRESRIIELREKDEEIIGRVIIAVNKILNGSIPKSLRKPYCKSCAYYLFCFG